MAYNPFCMFSFPNVRLKNIYLLSFLKLPPQGFCPEIPVAYAFFKEGTYSENKQLISIQEQNKFA